MTNPYASPAWPVPVATHAVRRVPLLHELGVGLLVTVYSIAFGGVLGIVWPHVAPHVDLARAYFLGSEAAATPLLGQDLWFGVLGLAAGVLCVAAVLPFGEIGRGPGGLIGLAVGGFVGSLVAAHLGMHTQRPIQVAELRHAVPMIDQVNLTRCLHFFGFGVRTKHVLLAWPIAAVVVHSGALLVRALRHGSAD
ncbi:MAG: hypothetical protein JO246_15865 [Frankiaceae bacterium]|nr:hypothetical protein [Frankiaceae bacterium]MBV9870309.1 hypothetical protein [Frankiaceae bacterium]